jgi:hypothetical protein
MSNDKCTITQLCLVFLREFEHGERDHKKSGCTANSCFNRGAHGNNSRVGNCSSLPIKLKEIKQEFNKQSVNRWISASYIQLK